MAEIVEKRASGRESERGTWLAVAGLLFILLIFYLPFDVLLTRQFVVQQKGFIEGVLTYAFGDMPGLVTRAYSLVVGAATVGPTMIQAIGGGVPELRRAHPISFGDQKIGVVWLAMPPVAAGDVYSDYVAYSTVMASAPAAILSFTISIGFEILVGLCVAYLWQKKWCWSRSKNELEYQKMKQKVEEQERKKRGLSGAFGGWLLVAGAVAIVLAVIASLT